MIPELGHLLAIFGWTAALGVLVSGFLGGYRQSEAWVALSIRLAKLQFVVLAGSFVLLIASFLLDDFSVLYVANNSNQLLPWYYKISAVWGAHEGSFLLWTLVAATWTHLVANRAQHIPLDIHGYVLGSLGFINFLFLAFLITASNPFERLVPNTPINGVDLNPLLQDFALIIHPPMLYIGYVGFAVAFSFGIAGLLTGKLDSAWARWLRPWVNYAWAFLTVGIALGSWWAYYELGWGGWWFWDPVENASLLPWLAGATLIHSLAATEKRGAYKNWTVLLVILTFSLSLVGAFLVRSGILTSVHAFAVDAQRGLLLLGILTVVSGAGLILFALRASTLRSRLEYWGISRELLLLINNVLLTITVATVLLGTLYPIGYEWFTDGEKISIGSQYFNAFFIPIMLVLSFFLALAPISQWKTTPLKKFQRCFVFLGIAAIVALILPWVLANTLYLGATIGIALGVFVLITHVNSLLKQRKSLNLGFVGMCIAHVGFAIALIGVAVTSVYSYSVDGRLAIGDSLDVSGRSYELQSVQTIEARNYIAEQAEFVVGNRITLYPERRFYPIRAMQTTEAAIRPVLFRDLYVTLGKPMDNGTWGVRIQEKLLIRWVWFGALIMAIAAVLACSDKRYRRLSKRDLSQYSRT